MDGLGKGVAGVGGGEVVKEGEGGVAEGVAECQKGMMVTSREERTSILWMPSGEAKPGTTRKENK